MGVRIIAGEDYAALYCSTSMFAFGPVLDDHDEAERFLQWLPKDARTYSDNELEHEIVAFREAHEKKEALETKRFEFVAHAGVRNSAVGDILNSAFEEDDNRYDKFDAAVFAEFFSEHTPEEIAQAWTLYQEYRASIDKE